MKKYVRANLEDAMVSCKRSAKIAADSLWDFQNQITGPKELSDYLTVDDINILDEARNILNDYAEDA